MQLFIIVGETYQRLSYLYKLSRQSNGKIIPETYLAIYEQLSYKTMLYKPFNDQHLIIGPNIAH